MPVKLYRAPYSLYQVTDLFLDIRNIFIDTILSGLSKPGPAERAENGRVHDMTLIDILLLKIDLLSN